MIIGLSGKSKSGKSTAGDYLVKNKNFTAYHFADPLKRGAMEMFGFTEEQSFGKLKDVIDPFWGVTPRDIHKILGTELLQFDIHKYLPAFEPIGRNIWLKKFELWYEDKKDKDIVFCDIRFQHELDLITKLGGKTYKINRYGLNMGDLHASELEMETLDGITSVIDNNGAIGFLYDQIDDILSSQ